MAAVFSCRKEEKPIVVPKAVYVHAPDNSSGHRVQDVEISYNYIGILPATLLYAVQNEKTA